ncbi:hypothetical protein AB0D10_30805 [Kitasatospora sp. NPDC048545]|uniref:hypothetical protein n=1 Tax=Kitasatospora sp. NPDC048545 TaxID=3157208 RepID=UPI0033F9EF82
MITTGPLAGALNRYPLVPRKRALARPLDHRVGRLTELAKAADVGSDLVAASGVHNLAALLAADRGLPDLARTLCFSHADLYLARRPLAAEHACLALEPLVNLANLAIREGDGSGAIAVMDELALAVASGNDAVLEGRTVTLADLTIPGPAKGDVSEWLDNVRVYDGARALVRAGRWVDAYLHLKQAGEGGRRMFDGRQVGAIALTVQGHTDLALRVLAEAPAEEPWEAVVASSLTVACMLLAGRPCAEQAEAMINAHCCLDSHDDMPIFDLRLALTVSDLAAAAGRPGDAERIFADAARTVLVGAEGYSARDLLAHPRSVNLTGAEREQLSAFVTSAGLGALHLSTDLEDRISAALTLATKVITTTLDTPPKDSR